MIHELACLWGGVVWGKGEWGGNDGWGHRNSITLTAACKVTGPKKVLNHKGLSARSSFLWLKITP